jgi:hypothetical protein
VTTAGRGDRRRRAAAWILAAAFVAVAAFELHAGVRGPSAAASVSADRSREMAAALEGVRERFLRIERRALDAAAALAPPVLAAVPHPAAGGDDRARLFEVLEREAALVSSPVSGVAVVDAAGAPLAWRGRVFDDVANVPPGASRGTRVVRTDVYKVIVAEEPLVGPGGVAAAAVRVFAPFNANFPLDNRYLRRMDFEAEAAASLGLEEVDLLFRPRPAADAEPLPPDTGRMPLEGVLGTRHAVLAAPRSAAVRCSRRWPWRRWRRGSFRRARCPGASPARWRARPPSPRCARCSSSSTCPAASWTARSSTAPRSP